MNRLVKAKYNEKEESFAYDLAGNRLKHTINGETQTYLYNRKNQLTQLHQDLGTTSFTYNQQGNMLEESTPQGVKSFEYNPLGQQVKVTTHDGHTLVNGYDAENLRVEMEENQRLTRFIFHRDEILVETDEQDSPISRFTRGYNVVASDIRNEDNTKARESDRYYYQLDEQGSTVFITSEDAKVENFYKYDAFGNVLESKERLHNRITYTGQQYDPVIQQYYLRARFYNPVLGRFMQEDVYRGDGLNLYAYCGNNPVMYYDPSGYCGDKEDCISSDGDGSQTSKDGVKSSFTNNIDDILAKQGISLDEFNTLKLKDASTLTSLEKATLKAIRESVPIPDADTVMQKVIPSSDIEKYLDGTYTQVGGYVTRAEDVTQLSTYDDIYNSLRLDYPKSAFKPLTDDSIGAIRYTTDEATKISIPYGKEMGGTEVAAQPFTGNGFTKATNGQIIPEFKCDGYLDVVDGSRLFEISKDGKKY